MERQILLCGHTVERIRADYGYDLFLLNYNTNGEIESGDLLLQLKATDSIRYEQREWDAQICLPVRLKDELMYGGHFIVAERTVEDRGVADTETFHRMLREAAQNETQVA